MPESIPRHITPDQAELLLDIAQEAIRARLYGTPYPGPAVDRLPEALQQPCGVFVTVLVGGALNGCIGTIETGRPLGACVARLAVEAAFEDPRLPALRPDQWNHTEIDLSLLTPPTAVPAHSRAQLLQQLTPGRHGLTIAGGGRRALFLPSMWDKLPDPDDFLDHLFSKAGLSPSPWPAELRAEVFTTECFSRSMAARTH